MADQWEYKYVNGQSREHELNQLGAQGWELVSVIQDVSGGLYNGNGAISTTVTFVFKRRKP